MAIEIEDVKTLTLKEGQVLVVQFDTRYTKDIFINLSESICKAFPNNRVVFLDNRIKLAVVDSIGGVEK